MGAIRVTGVYKKPMIVVFNWTEQWEDRKVESVVTFADGVNGKAHFLSKDPKDIRIPDEDIFKMHQQAGAIFGRFNKKGLRKDLRQRKFPPCLAEVEDQLVLPFIKPATPKSQQGFKNPKRT